jgi:RNA polymerase sigma-70 factor (ECF subfamily)
MQEPLTTSHQARADPGQNQVGNQPGDLLRRALAGDGDALNRLCRENWLPVYRSVARWAGTPAEAEDLTQDVFVRAIQSIGNYRGADLGIPFRAYLLRISRNLAIDRWRARQAAGAVTHQPIGEENMPWLPDVGIGLEASVIKREEHARLLAALDRLPDAYSDVLRQRILCGLTAAEVAARTGQTANAVRQLQFRAMTALRREFATDQDGEDR